MINDLHVEYRLLRVCNPPPPPLPPHHHHHYPVRLGLLQSTFRGELKETMGVCGAVGVSCAPPLFLAGRTGEECREDTLLPASLTDALLLLRVRRPRPNRDFEVSETGGTPGTFSSPSCKP